MRRALRKGEGGGVTGRTGRVCLCLLAALTTAVWWNVNTGASACTLQCSAVPARCSKTSLSEKL